MAKEAVVVQTGPWASSLSDPAWCSRADSVLEQLNDQIAEWQHRTLEVGYLLREVQANGYFRRPGYDSFGEFVESRGWNRRQCNGMIRIHDVCCIQAGIERNGLEGADLQLLYEARRALTANRAQHIVRDARAVGTGKKTKEEFRQLWVIPTFPSDESGSRSSSSSSASSSSSSSSAARRSAPQRAERSKIDQTIEGILGWTHGQIGLFLKRLTESLERTHLLSPDQCVSLVEALEDAAGDQFVRDVCSRGTFFTPERSESAVRALLHNLDADALARVAGDLEERLSEAPRQAAAR